MFSTLFSVLSAYYQKRVLSSGRRRRQPESRRPFRPSLECLEERSVPAVLHVGTSEPYHTIASALLAANPGDTVLVQPGTYQEAVNITKNNITLEGVNQSAIIESPSTLAPLAANGYSIVRVNGATGVTIEDLTVEGTYSGGFGTTANGVLLGLHAGIYVANGGSATISDNHVTNIRDNPPNTTSDDGFGILIGSNSSVLNTTGSAVVENNTVDNYQSSGIDVANAGSHATIKNNTVTGLSLTLANQYNEQVGITAEAGGTGLISGNKVTGNVQTGKFAVGIYLESSGAGVSVTDNTVTGNNTGIYAFGIQGGTIASNRDSHNIDSGILMINTVGTTVTDNKLTGNSTGIQVFSGQGGTIASNKVSNNTGDAIDLFSTSGVTLLANKTNGNGGTGITLFSSTDNVFLLNSVKHNDAFGIFVDSASTGNLFLLNSMKDNGADDAFDTTTGSGTVGTANTWIFNKGKTDSPSGLLS